MAKRYEKPRLGIREAVSSAPVELGQRIVDIRNACSDCHGKDLGGFTFANDGFVGKLQGPNITSAALKDWSDDEIAVAIRYGIGRDGRPLIMMPAHDYQHMAKEDLAAVIAYLRTVPAVDRKIGPPELGPGAKLLYAAGKLPTLLPVELVDHSRGFAQKPVEDATAEFGQYLAVTACAGCHGSEYKGGPVPGAPPDWAPASSLRLGADARWTQASFTQTMRSGKSALDGHDLRMPMPVELAKKMSDAEVGALWSYLSTLK
jgi:mono/diheme cytochrome c family protein